MNHIVAVWVAPFANNREVAGDNAIGDGLQRALLNAVDHGGRGIDSRARGHFNAYDDVGGIGVGVAFKLQVV